MNLTDQKEFDKIMDWVHSSECYRYPEIEEARDSYFEPYDAREMYELVFRDINDLKEILSKRKQVVEDDRIDLVCAVAVFRRKSRISTEEETGKKKELPDFVYVF